MSATSAVPGPPTVHDLFCGGGGTSVGLAAAGYRVELAINHNPVAVATHQAALPATRHLCADVTQVDPAAFAAPAMLWASAECTTFSPGRGPAAARARAAAATAAADARFVLSSRATGFDLLRWVDAHRGRLAAVVAENVLEWASWELFDVLRDGLDRLGYASQVVHHNAALAGSAARRDRLFLVAWHRDRRPPDLTVTAPAACPQCGPVDAVQRYRRPRRPSDHRFGMLGPHWSLACRRCGSWAEPTLRSAADILEPDVGPPVADSRLKATTRARIRNAIAALAVPDAKADGPTRRLIVLHWSKPPSRRRHAGDVGGGWWDAAVRPLNTVTGVDSHAVVTIPTVAPGTEVDDALVDWLAARAHHRMLHVSELGRALGFPEDYPLAGTDRQQRIQLGMAVPPPLAAWFGRRLRPVVDVPAAAA